MEFYACLIGGALLIACGLSLFRLRPPDWSSDGELADVPHKAIVRWAFFQRALRWTNNGLLALIGAGIMASAFVPHGRIWMLLWSVILLALLLCILCATLDAFSSLAGYRRALPEAARRSFGSDQEHIR